MTGRWGGRRVTELRAAWAPRVAAGGLACPRCGLLIAPGQAWDLGHQTARSAGGSDDPTNLAPEHTRCNRRAGAALIGDPRTRLGAWL